MILCGDKKYVGGWSVGSEAGYPTRKDIGRQEERAVRSGINT